MCPKLELACGFVTGLDVETAGCRMVGGLKGRVSAVAEVVDRCFFAVVEGGLAFPTKERTP